MSNISLERRTEIGIERQCRHCRDWWPLDEFCKAKNCRRGRSAECKACRSERRARRWRELPLWRRAIEKRQKALTNRRRYEERAA